MLTRHLRADVVMLLGLLQGDTRASTPKPESCLVAMVHEAPSKRDRARQRQDKTLPWPAGEPASILCLAHERHNATSKESATVNGIGYSQASPRMSATECYRCIIGDSLHENATSEESSDYGINGIRGDR
ncbi:hypothetical protein BZA70DRAFT_292159 [Myxozyma melibiosi]|uniref:Secreted protein n=1 Tax=Myxozyma melibiosi TaxID=54550 RepID=A0ABR1EYN3_9ASCO